MREVPLTPFVDFEPIGRRGDCPAGTSLLDCARQLGVDLVNLCAGTGRCGGCKVQILEGATSALTRSEEEFFSVQEVADGYRLACQAIPLGDCKVHVPPESLTTPQRTQVEGREITVRPEPPIQILPVTLSPPSLDDVRANADRLQESLQRQHAVAASAIDLGVLRELPPRPREGRWQIDVAVRGGEIVAITTPPSRPLGLAVDLGTTKIAGYLVDPETGWTLASHGLMNPQIAYGEDVIARKVFAQQSPEQARLLQTLVIEALNQLVAEVCAQVQAEPANILEAVVVGNTAMHHLFLRLPIEQLALAPYVPAVRTALDVKARDLGLYIAPGGYVHLLPNIAGYVGADHVAMLVATDTHQAQGVVLALDVGTNTEVCLANDGRLTSLSCASGPAFEGAHIHCGMRAAQGAIERLCLVGERVEYQTIGGTPPIGLCGSGILDTLAELYRAGVVDARGKMHAHPRMRLDREIAEFVLVDEDEQTEGQPAITFTQKDVRELQLAKGAIRAGIQVLLQFQGIVEKDIDKVVIAGAFGTYIDIDSAITIGMLPQLSLDKFRQVGNAAGMGAKMALISQSVRDQARSLAQQVRHIELATVPNIETIFAQATYLGDDLFGKALW